MNSKLQEIKNAIDSFDLEIARSLLREELRNAPSADAYMLAAQVALTEEQKINFLEKAVQSDPFHPKAAVELQKIKKNGQAAVPNQSQPVTNQTSSAAPAQRPTGITIWAILAIIGGALGILIAPIGMNAPSNSGLGLVLLVLSVIAIAYGIGFLQLKRWAWQLAQGALGVGLFFGIITVLVALSNPYLPSDNKIGAIIGFLVGAGINAGLFSYLRQARIKQAFT